MKKLFVLALIGLVFGGVLWRTQNPDGNVETFRAQATAQVERLKVGADAVLATGPNTKPQAGTDQAVADNESVSSDVSESVSSLQSSLSDVQSAVKDVTAGNDAGIVRLDAIDSRLELLVRRLDEQGFEGDIGTLSSTLSDVQAEVQGLQQTLQTRNNDVDNRISDVSEQVSSLGLRLDTLATSGAVAKAGAQGDAEGGTEAAQNDAGANTSQALALASSGIDERFKVLEEQLQTVNSDSRKLTELNEQLATLQSSITELNEKTAANSQSLDTVGSTIEDLQTAGESLSIETVQAEIRDQLALVQSQVESDAASDNTDALEGLLDTTRTRIRTLEQRVQELPASSSEATNAQQIQAALESQIVALERRLESINSADPELANTLSTVQEKVDQLEAKEFVTQDDLNAQNETRSVEYKIYFDRNSVEITEDAITVLDSFIAQEKNRTVGVSIFGFTDRRGSATYNQQLALQRATNVRSYLIQNGIDYTSIKALTGLGEDAAAVVLPDNADDAQQRVVVLYSAQP